MKMKRRSNAKTQEKTKLQKLFPIQKKLLNLYNALLQASSFSKDEFYNNFNINDKHNCDKLIQKARIVFSEFDIIGVGTVGEDTLICFNPPLNKMEHGAAITNLWKIHSNSISLRLTVTQTRILIILIMTTIKSIVYVVLV